MLNEITSLSGMSINCWFSLAIVLIGTSLTSAALGPGEILILHEITFSLIQAKIKKLNNKTGEKLILQIKACLAGFFQVTKDKLYKQISL